MVATVRFTEKWRANWQQYLAVFAGQMTRIPVLIHQLMAGILTLSCKCMSCQMNSMFFSDMFKINRIRFKEWYKNQTICVVAYLPQYFIRQSSMETTPPSGPWFPCWAPRELSWKISNNNVVLRKFYPHILTKVIIKSVHCEIWVCHVSYYFSMWIEASPC